MTAVSFSSSFCPVQQLVNRLIMEPGRWEQQWIQKEHMFWGVKGEGGQTRKCRLPAKKWVTLPSSSLGKGYLGADKLIILVTSTRITPADPLTHKCGAKGGNSAVSQVSSWHQQPCLPSLIRGSLGRKRLKGWFWKVLRIFSLAGSSVSGRVLNCSQRTCSGTESWHRCTSYHHRLSQESPALQPHSPPLTAWIYSFAVWVFLTSSALHNFDIS